MALLTTATKVQQHMIPSHFPRYTATFAINNLATFDVRVELSRARTFAVCIPVGTPADPSEFPVFNFNIHKEIRPQIPHWLRNVGLTRESVRSLIFSLFPPEECSRSQLPLLPAIDCSYPPKPLKPTFLMGPPVAPIALAPSLTTAPIQFLAEPPQQLRQGAQSENPPHQQAQIQSAAQLEAQEVEEMQMSLALPAVRNEPLPPDDDCVMIEEPAQEVMLDLNEPPAKETVVYVRRSSRIRMMRDGVRGGSVERASQRKAGSVGESDNSMSSGGAASGRRRKTKRLPDITTLAPLPVSSAPPEIDMENLEELARCCGIDTADIMDQALKMHREANGDEGSSKRHE